MNESIINRINEILAEDGIELLSAIEWKERILIVHEDGDLI